MKKFLFAILAFAPLALVPFTVIADAAEFGEPVPPADEALTVSQAIEAADEIEGEVIILAGRITQVCQHRGCWAIFAEGEDIIRVMAEDHSFEMPADSSGPAFAQGRLERRELSEEHVEHLIEDDGADPALRQEPVEYRLIATGVRMAEVD